MEINKTAIVVVEFQKTWTGKSFFHKLIREQYVTRNVYQNTKELLDYARTKGVKIIQAPLILDKTDKGKYKQIPFQPKLFRQFTANTWKAEYTEGIYKKSDIEVTGRCGFDACEGSNLLKFLIDNNITNVFILGFTTDHCIQLTAKTLISIGYDCTIISDCTATRNNKLQKKVEKNFKTLKSPDVIKKLDTE